MEGPNGLSWKLDCFVELRRPFIVCPTCGGPRVLLVVPDLREILSGTKRATLRLLSGAGRCGVRVVGKRVQAQIREAVPGQVLIQLHPRRKDQPARRLSRVTRFK